MNIKKLFTIWTGGGESVGNFISFFFSRLSLRERSCSGVLNVLANWVGLQNKARWQWITQMFHCGKSAICCASNRIVSQISPCSTLPQFTHHLLPCCGVYGMKSSQSVASCRWALLHQLWGQQRMEWRLFHTQLSVQGVSTSGQVLLALKSLETGMTLKAPIWGKW